MERTIENIEQVDVRKMNREELLTFLYKYINTGKYLERYYSSTSKKIEENEQARVNDLIELDKKYDSFYFQNLSLHEAKAKEKLSDRTSFRNKLFTLESIPLYMKILIILLPFMIFGLNNSMEALGFMLGIIIFTVILCFVFPIFVFIPLLLVGLFNFLYKIFSAVAKTFISFSNRVYVKYVLKQARKKDILSAKNKGITKENIKEVFKYKEIKDEINYKYDELENKIKSWNFDEKKEIEIQHRQLKCKLPIDNQKLEYIIYMYNQLEVGANDNWKESINDLKLQLRHDELKNELRQISNNIIQSNNQLVKMNQDINRRISNLDQMVTNEQNRLNARMDGFFDYLECYGYYY